MTGQDLKELKIPANPGVYFFIGRDKEIFYIGKATSLVDRLRSYFRNDLFKTRGPLLVDMVTQAYTIEYVETDSVLEALILEVNLIKKYQPRFNIKEKDDKSFNYVVITKEDFPRVLLVRGKELYLDTSNQFASNKIKFLFGPYPQALQLKEALKIIRKIFPYRDMCQPPQPGKSIKPCFNRHIGLCPGVCTGEISKEQYAETIRNLVLFFQAKKQTLLNRLKKQMNQLSKEERFEEAHRIKKTLFALTHIQDVSLIKEEKSEKNTGIIKDQSTSISSLRIEGYDIAHLGGSQMAGVMVVMEDRMIKKSQYRLFRIKKQKGIDDITALKEVLERRLNHEEWLMPQIVVVDGGLAQKNAAEQVLREKKIQAEVISVVKNEKHQPERLLGSETLKSRYYKEILLINSEAHRFAIKYHRKLRESSLGI